jgi:hypothetical protein
MPPRDDGRTTTTPGWSPARLERITERTETIIRTPPMPAPLAPPIPSRDASGQWTLWRSRKPRVPTPRPKGRPIPTLVNEPRAILDVDDFHALRREGLFDDDGRNPPPSWWAR